MANTPVSAGVVAVQDTPPPVEVDPDYRGDSQAQAPIADSLRGRSYSRGQADSLKRGMKPPVEDHGKGRR